MICIFVIYLNIFFPRYLYLFEVSKHTFLLIVAISMLCMFAYLLLCAVYGQFVLVFFKADKSFLSRMFRCLYSNISGLLLLLKVWINPSEFCPVQDIFLHYWETLFGYIERVIKSGIFTRKDPFSCMRAQREMSNHLI